MHQPGSDSLKTDDLEDCILKARKKTEAVVKLINVALDTPDR